MSLTSYRAAPPRDRVVTRTPPLFGRGCWHPSPDDELCMGSLSKLIASYPPAAMPGDDLLFHRLSDSTIGAVGFHGRVRDGIGWDTDAIATRQWSGRMNFASKWDFDAGVPRVVWRLPCGGPSDPRLVQNRCVHLLFSWECIIRLMQPKVVIDGV